MSDETTEQREAESQETPDPAGTDGAEGGSSEQKQAGGQANDELEKLRASLKAANSEAATRRHRIQELEEQIKAKERAGMDETERLKAELADLQAASTERDQLKAKAEALETAVGGQVEALLKELDVPGHIQELIEPMDAAGKLAYLTKNRAAFVKADEKKKPDIDAGNKGGSGKKPAEIDEKRRKEIRQRYRMRGR